jgi:hypothetical protein
VQAIGVALSSAGGQVANHLLMSVLAIRTFRFGRQLVRPCGASLIDPKQSFRLRLAWGRDRTQNVPENAKLQFERLRAVVLVVTCRHRGNEIALRDDAN